MIVRTPRARAGITLTEILISILIMGIGLISLATLFPIGLLRLRNAQRLARSALVVESASDELSTRNLFSKSTFINQALVNLPTDTPPGLGWFKTAPSGQYDPWIQDTPGYGVDWGPTANPAGVGRQSGPGLPVAYDPLWRYQT